MPQKASIEQIADPGPTSPHLHIQIYSELKRERAWSRIHLIPLLMAESDRDAYRRNEAQIAREKEIMKDVPGWEAGKSVYNTKRYTPPNFVVL